MIDIDFCKCFYSVRFIIILKEQIILSLNYSYAPSETLKYKYLLIYHLYTRVYCNFKWYINSLLYFLVITPVIILSEM